MKFTEISKKIICLFLVLSMLLLSFTNSFAESVVVLPEIDPDDIVYADGSLPSTVELYEDFNMNSLYMPNNNLSAISSMYVGGYAIAGLAALGTPSLVLAGVVALGLGISIALYPRINTWTSNNSILAQQMERFVVYQQNIKMSETASKSTNLAHEINAYASAHNFIYAKNFTVLNTTLDNWTRSTVTNTAPVSWTSTYTSNGFQYTELINQFSFNGTPMTYSIAATLVNTVGSTYYYTYQLLFQGSRIGSGQFTTTGFLENFKNEVQFVTQIDYWGDWTITPIHSKIGGHYQSYDYPEEYPNIMSFPDSQLVDAGVVIGSLDIGEYGLTNEDVLSNPTGLLNVSNTGVYTPASSISMPRSLILNPFNINPDLDETNDILHEHSSILTTILAWLKSIFDKINILDDIRDFLRNIWEFLRDTITDFIDDLLNALQNLSGFFEPILAFVADLVSFITGYLLYEQLFSHFLPQPVAVFVWIAWECFILFGVFKFIIALF